MELCTVLQTSEAPRACASCKKRKRKCNKALPRCAFCTRHDWNCDYSDPRRSSSAGSRDTQLSPGDSYPSSGASCILPELLDNAIQSLESSVFPPVYFLDSRIFQQAQLEIPNAQFTIPLNVTALVGDSTSVRSLATQFFETIHPWMPIIAKKRFYRHLLNPLSQPRADLALLLLSMRLITWMPTPYAKNPRNSIYLAAKQYYTNAVNAGIFTIQVLQAGIFITLYEYGHSIYPSAYLSIGSCARHGVALGIDSIGEPVANKMLDWIDIEERRRAWWAILILDRIVNLGNPSRRLATGDPSHSDILPIDDAIWDQGQVSPPSRLFTLSSTSSLEMGRFARFAQATHLLGRVFRHVSDHTADESFHNDEAIQLHRTIRALAHLSEYEGKLRRLECCPQTATCYNALLILQPHPAVVGGQSTDRQSGTDLTINLEDISTKAVMISQNFLSRGNLPIEKVSPFTLHLIYQATVISMRLNQESGNKDSSDALNTLQQAMSRLGERWMAAGSYTEILRAQEVMWCC